MRFRSLVVVVLCVAVLVGLYSCEKASEPPREASVIEAFKAHRATYERLREMLAAEDQLARVAAWGVETTESPLAEIPPKGGFPVGRFTEYLSLLNAIHSKGAYRIRGLQPGECVAVWGAGWGGDTRHVDLCSVDQVPANQVNDLDAFYRSPKPRGPVYRHIDGNWYIWADW